MPCASDVYSFGIVAWEVLSRELPWGSVSHPQEVYIPVVLKERVRISHLGEKYRRLKL